MTEQDPKRRIVVRPVPPDAFQAVVRDLPPDARRRIEPILSAWRSASVALLLRQDESGPPIEVIRNLTLREKLTDAILFGPGATPRDVGRAVAALLVDRQQRPTVTGVRAVPLSLSSALEHALPEAGLPLLPEIPSDAEELDVAGIGKVLILKCEQQGLNSSNDR